VWSSRLHKWNISSRTVSIVSILASAVGDLAVHAQPNLRPLPPAGWPVPLIISTRQGDRQTATEAYDDQDLYIDWAVRNTSTTAAVWGRFYYRLTVDGYKWFEWYNDYVAPGNTDWVEDYLLGRLNAGVHTIRIEADVTRVIHETNESDNAYERQITILPRRANGHFYALTTKAGTWHEAQVEATSYGGHLVTITSLSEQRFVVGNFLRNGFETKPLWIGLTDHVQEGVFRWVTGEPFEFANWNPQEPNNCGNEDYVAINWHVAHNRSNSRLGDWNDAPAAGTDGCFFSRPESYFGIIEWNTEPTGFPGQVFQWAGPVAEPETVWRRTAGGNDHAYQAFWVAEGITWSEAKAFAEGRGGTLASITSSSENTFVAALIQHDRFWQDRRRYGSDVSFGPWLGGYQPTDALEPAGGWRWITGEIFSYSNWDTHQPDNYGPNGESRLHFFQGNPPGRRDLWNDEEPDTRMGGFIVEYSGALPQISSVSPNPVVGRDARQTITINGANFVNKPTVTLTWSGQPGYRLPDGQVTFISANKLEIAIVTGTAADTWTVKVTNADGRSSEPFPFTVQPAACPPGASAFGLTIITHGYQWDRAFPLWLKDMAEAIAARLRSDQTQCVPIYRMVVTDNSGVIKADTIRREDSCGHTDVTFRSLGAAILIVDWSDVAGGDFGNCKSPWWRFTETWKVADAVFSHLQDHQSDLGGGGGPVFPCT
jgi:hypothetical protein